MVEFLTFWVFAKTRLSIIIKGAVRASGCSAGVISQNVTEGVRDHQ